MTMVERLEDEEKVEESHSHSYPDDADEDDFCFDYCFLSKGPCHTTASFRDDDCGRLTTTTM